MARGIWSNVTDQDTASIAAAQAAATAASDAAARAMTRANQANAAAAAAQTTGQNAAASTADLAAAVASGNSTHADLYTQIASLNTRLANIQLTPGPDGPSAYQIARNHGYGGTETQWLATLTGANGPSAYDLAVAAGYGGTITQWIASLKGNDGSTPTISIGTVTGLAAGATPTATLTGTTTARVLNLGIPAGAQGAAGVIQSVTIASGTAATPLLAFNAQADVTVTLDKSMGSTTYNVDLILPTALIGASTISVKTKTAGAVVLTVKATIALGASSIGVITWTTT